MTTESLESALDFAQRYVTAEHSLETLAHTIEDDQAFWAAQHKFRDAWFTPELCYHSTAPRHRPEMLANAAAKRTQRPLFRVEAHQNDTVGTLFSMQIGNPTPSRKGQYSFDLLYQFAEVDGARKILSKWTSCTFCYAGGLGRDGATCAECKGHGWLHPSDEVFGPRLPLGQLLFSKRVEQTEHRRSKIANDKPERLPSDPTPSTRDEIGQARSKAEAGPSHSDPFRTFAESVLLPPSSRAATESYDLAALAAVKSAVERQACELMLLEKLRAKDDDPRLVAALLSLGTDSAMTAMREALSSYAERTETHRALREALPKSA